MPFKPSLRAFLRQEVKRSRIQVEPAPPSRRAPPCGSTPACATPSPSIPTKPAPTRLAPRAPDSLSDEDSVRGGSTTPDNGVDCLFGELVTEVATKRCGKEERVRAELQKLASHGSEGDGLPSKPKGKENLKLLELRRQLEALVDREMAASREEKIAMRGQRSEMIQRISRIESADREVEAERLRATPNQAAGLVLPEPVGAREKKALLVRAEKIFQARAGLERSPRKRTRQDDERDLDGEDLLRLGRRVKKRPPTHTTGHWKASIHDYFPGADRDGEVGRLEGWTAEKQLLRRELAELGENLAKADRRKKKKKKLWS
ncbi:hypothetical protein BUE80_DR000123 [Diplocarpon rosae]|nr:hypothetical protein BUE80_DR000123 [Diplocarpon rosae]